MNFFDLSFLDQPFQSLSFVTFKTYFLFSFLILSLLIESRAMDCNDTNLYDESLISHYLDPASQLRSLTPTEAPLTDREEFCLKRVICQLKLQTKELNEVLETCQSFHLKSQASEELSSNLATRLLHLEGYLKQHEWIAIYLKEETVFSYNSCERRKK